MVQAKFPNAAKMEMQFVAKINHVSQKTIVLVKKDEIILVLFVLVV